MYKVEKGNKSLTNFGPTAPRIPKLSAHP